MPVEERGERILEKKRHITVSMVFPLQDPDEHKTMCPYCTMKPELCIAALASSMINKQECFSGRYHRCALFPVNNRKGREELKYALPGDRYVG
jgi:hypothetical protein